MRRAIMTALTLALILGTTEGQSRQVSASTRLSNLWTVSAGNANRGEWRWDQCRFRHLEDGWGWNVHEVELTIRCAVRHWAVDGGAEKALAVARCESGLNELAYNAGGYAGVFQQAVRYWDGRFVYYAPRWWRLRPPVFNGRSNVVVSIRMAHARGWYADWACA